MELTKYKQIMLFAKELDEVFTLQDLEIALGAPSKASLYRNVTELLENKDLILIKNGFYATPNASLVSICSRIYPNSYISTGTVLAKNNIIGSVPQRRIQAVKIGLPRVYECKLGTIEFLSIKEKYFLGFEKTACTFWASSEKAFLDSCYFYFKGKSFSFNLESDINFDLLNFKLINKLLSKYDKRFVSFFKNYWGKYE